MSCCVPLLMLPEEKMGTNMSDNVTARDVTARDDDQNAGDHAPQDDGLRWLLMGITILMGLFGLVLAAKAHDTGAAFAGWTFFLFAVAYNFAAIRRIFAAPPPPTEP